MRSLLFIIWALIMCAAANGQNKIRRFEYWFNQADNQRSTQITTASQVLELNTEISTGELPPGLHTLHYRFADDSGRYSGTASQHFVKPAPASPGRVITSMQYWFDDRHNDATTMALSNQQVTTITTQLNSAAMITGLHLVHCRFRDNTGAWSITYSQAFYKMPEPIAGSSQVNAYQYWFDDAFGSSVIQNISAQQVVQISFDAQSAQLPAGMHTFHIRFRDNRGQWSLTESAHFYRMPQQSVTGRKIVSYHYWFDDQLATGVMQTVSGEQAAIINLSANTTSLPGGMHQFHIRFKDDAGFWSGTLSQYFYKAEPASAPNLITAYQYWVNENDQQKVLVNLPTPVNPLQTPIEADLGALEEGKYAIHFQFRDTKGMWSMATTDSINVQAIFIYTFTGNGNWSNAANWANGAKPSSPLATDKEIIIDHADGGECLLDIPFTIGPGARLTVKPGKKLRIAGNLLQEK